jgi:outer membrane protein assembly factor BamE (lipoprotein component of BamABCDE complex)
MNRPVSIVAAAIGLFAVALASPVTAKKESSDETANTLTHGMVQMTLRVGETKQYDVLQSFGAPNITTVDGSGQEVWVYDREATVTSDSHGGFSIGLGLGGGGGGAAGAGLLGFGKSKNKSTTSSRTMMLVIKFDGNKVVSDFRSRSSSF